MKSLLLAFLLPSFLYAQNAGGKTIKIHFLYGSKPAKGFKQQETKWFGGILGGHVTIEINSLVIGFAPIGKNHILPHSKETHASFQKENLTEWVKDTSGLKYTSVEIPVTDSAYAIILETIKNYSNQPPYDYAVFGMRCAAAAYDILGKAGLLKEHSRLVMVCKNFYPKPFRRRILKLALQNNYTITSHDGRKSRKWERR